jgi:hypothetical protein
MTLAEKRMSTCAPTNFFRGYAARPSTPERYKGFREVSRGTHALAKLVCGDVRCILARRRREWIMTEPDSAICMTCHGAGEIPTDFGPEVCPDCQGDQRSPGRRQLLEWRLRDIERVHLGQGHSYEPDVRWLVHQVRTSREALVRILSMSLDAEPGPFVAEVQHMVNAALEFYEPA